MSEGIETAVSSDAGAATAESTSTPESSQSTVAADSAASSQGTNNASRTYSEEHLQKVLRERLEQQKRSYEKRLSEFETKTKQYEGYWERLSQAEYARAKALGYVQEEQPKPVTQQDIESRFAEFERRMSEQQQKVEEARLYNKLKADYEHGEREAGDWAQVPGFKQAFVDAWGKSNGTKSPAEIAKAIVSGYEKVLAARQNQVAATKEATLKSQPVKGGGGTASPAPADAGGPMHKQIMAALRASRG